MKQNLLFNRANAFGMRFIMVLTMLLIVGIGQAWGAEGDTHNFPQSLSQLLNNNASVASIEIAEQSYAIKTVKITSDYNKTAGGVTMEVFVGGISWGTATHNSDAEKTFTFNGTSTKGTVTIKFTNNCTSGTGKGTFKVSSVQLVEGAAAKPYTVTFHTTATAETPLTEAAAGAGVTPPTMEEECGDWTFQGWSESQSNSETSTTKLELVTLTSGKYYPTADVDLYPVYTKTTSTGGTAFDKYTQVSLGGTITSGKYLISTGSYTMAGNGKTGAIFSPGSTEKTEYEYTITVDGSYFTILGPDDKYVGGANSTTLQFGTTATTDSYQWNYVNAGIQNKSYTTRRIRANGKSDFRHYANTNGTTTYLYKRTEKSSGSTYYYSYPQCTTETVVYLHPNFGSESATQITTGAPTYTVPDCSFTRDGYTFFHWDTQADDSGTDYAPGTTINLNGRDVNLYAQWTSNSYTVIFNANGGTGEMDNQPFNYDEEKALSANEFTRKGHTFVNWNNKDDGSGDDFDDEEEVKNLSTINGDTYNLYAQWECVTPTISTQPQSATYLRDDDADALSVVAAASDATLTYQWQKSTDNSTWSDITGATEATYKPSTQSVGTTYYQVVVTNSEGNCSATSDVATITVRSANCKWVETEIGDIKSGDEVVIAMQKIGSHGTPAYYALNSSKGTEAYPPAEQVSIENQTITSNVSDPIIWNISGNATDGYVFYPNGSATTWLYCTGSSNTVKVGTGTANTFYIENNYLKNTQKLTVNGVPVDAYVGVSILTSSWRHYPTTTGTSVIADQTLKLYKKECLPTGKYWINYDLTNVVCTDDPIKNKISTDDNAVELNFEATGEHNELPTTIIVTNGSTTLAKNTDYNWSNGVLTILNPSQITDNITISIAAQKRKYTVTFDANGHGTAPAAQSVTAEGTASEPTAPEATGYTFGGWYKEPECTTAFDFATPITGNITLYAKWTVNKYTITFKNYDGTELQSSEVAYGETPSYTGAAPTREQTAQYTYTFKGWSPTIAPATQDQVYTAQFNQTTRSYTVIWYDGTGNAHKTQTAGYNATVALPTTNPDPCDDDYPHFIGWTADPIVGPTTTQPELVEDVKVTGDCDYYAVFAKGEGGSSNYQKVTSALDDWSGEYLIVYETGKVAFNGGLSTLDAASNTIGVTISDNTIESNSTTDAARFTIAAVSGGYTIKSASGYYIGQNSYSNGLSSSTSTTYTNTISHDGETITINGTGNERGTKVALKYNDADNQHRFRYYKSGQKTIALYKKGSGVNYTSYITTCCTSWTAPTLTYTTPLEENGTAMPQLGAGTTHGTVTYASSNPSILSVNSTTGEISAQAPGTATVTATWSGDETYCSVSSKSNVITVKGSFSVIFKANGGTGTMANQKADENNKIAQLNANQFTRTGYAFVGWNTSSYGTGTAYTDQQTNITLAQNLTLYAQWAPVVTLNDAGNVTTTHPETAGGSITLEDGANACDPYEFVGWTAVAIGDWNEGINEPALVATTYTPNAPTTLYAVYKIQSEGNANAFKLSFEGGNGKTYYVGSYNNSPYLRGYSNITKEEAVTFIRTKMYPDNDTKYYIYMEHKSEYLYYNGTFNSTSSTPDENQGWVFHTVGDKIKLQSTYSYDPDYLSFSDRDEEKINISTSTSGSEFNMLSAVTSTYVASPLCNQEIEIIFETGNGNFVDNAPDTNPLTVSRGDVITLPTCEYPGYEFMGWLKDEQQLDPSDILGTYYTGDYTVDGISQSITFYAYYKAIPEEVEFTGKDDAELLMYYYDGTANYYYAVSHAAERGELSSKQNCFNATTWTFTNVGNMQYYIQDETGKYLGAYSDGDNDLILSATSKVWTFTEVNGLWKMVCENSPSRALMYISTGKKFANAAISNEGNGAYSYVSLGICPSPTYTTNPVLTQGFTITNTVKVTSASGQKVKATSALTLETRNIELPCTFTITAPNITFYDNTGAEVTQLTASAASEQFELYFAYQPTAENTMEYPTVTIVDDELKTYTIKNRIQARSLPNTFAVVAKVGGIWYALPSQGLNSTDDLMGYPVEVDNQDDPTVVTKAPANADWSLRQVYAGQNANATKDRFKQYGANLVFVNSDVKALNASQSNYVLTDALYSNYYDQYPGRYEWTPTTTDLETYQLTNAERTDRKLSIDILTRFGIYKGEIENMRFLPIKERYTPASLQVVEWKKESIVIMYTGDPAQTATLAIDGTTAIGSANLNEVNKDVAIYELPASGLMNYATKRLLITIGNGQKWLTIPYIINNSTTDAAVLNSTSTTKAVAAVTDVVVLNGATFTAAGTKNNKYTFRTIHVYGGGKLVVPASATEGLGIYSLILRLGTVENGTYTNSYPQLVMNGKYSNTSGIYLDYITTYERYYALSVPYPVKTKNIKYPADIYGDNLKSGNKASFALQYYDGAARATGATGWKDFDESGDEPTLTPYQGYTFWGAPRKVSVNGGDAQRPKFGIHRIQLTGVGADSLLTAETNAKTIDIAAHPAERPNDMGWNFLGNPYLAQYGGLSADNELVQVGLLEQEMIDGKWTGGWKHTGNLRYVTTTTDGQNYTAVEVDKATFSPFNTFFIQAATGGALSFASASRAQSLPARHYAAQQETAKEITTGIILTGNNQTDRTGLLIADNFTEEYDFNADLSKFENSGINLYTIGKTGNLAYMAINQALAEQPIPVGYSAPAEGLYTIAFDEDRYDATDISALYLIDYDFNEKTNLLHTDYSFVTAAGTNNQRFALQVVFAPENATNIEWVGDATIQVGVEGNELILNNLPTDAAVHVFDALGRLMYHTPHAPTEMQLTLPTGYYLVHIADKQHAAVINTVIP